jgi:uncharacterized protein YhaN
MSEPRSVQIQSVKVHRAPGFPDGMQILKGFSPGISLIVGPNGSGKSTLARSLKSLFWPAPGRIEATADFRFEDFRWQVRVSGEQQRFQKEGQPADIPFSPDTAGRDRNMLALHDLIRADDADLAASIYRDSVGGYDIDTAAAKLGYSNTVRSRTIAEAVAFRNAADGVQQITSRQQRLLSDFDQLQQLRHRLKTAESAGRKAAMLKLLLEYNLAKSRLHEANVMLQSFPESLSKMQDDDVQNIEHQENRIRDLTSNIEALSRSLTQLKDQLHGYGFSDEQGDATLIEELDLHASDWERAAADEKAASLLIQEKAEQRNILASQIGLNEMPEGAFSDFDPRTLRDLDTAVRQAMRAAEELERAEIQADKAAAALGQESGDDPDVLRDGLRALQAWLGVAQVQDKRERHTDLVVGILLIITAAGVLMAGAWGLTGLLAILVVLLWKRVSGKKNDNTLKTMRQQDFLRTGLESPSIWNAENVLSSISDLSSRFQRAIMAEELHARLRESQQNLATVRLSTQPALDRIENLGELATTLLRASGHQTSYSELYHSLKVLLELIDTDASLSGLNERHALARKFCEEARHSFANLITRLSSDFATPESPEQAVAIVRTQRTFYQKWIELRSQITHHQDRLESARALLKDAHDAKNSVIHRLGVDQAKSDTLAAVKSLSNNLPEYRNAAAEYQSTSIKHTLALEPLKNHADFTEECLDLSPEDIENQLRNCQEQAGSIPELNEKITQTLTLVRQAGEAKDLERALNHRDETLEALSRVYLDNLNAIAGDTIARQLKKAVTTDHMPEVMKKAAALFTRFTRGRYRLELIRDPEVAFYAFDVRENEGKTLDQLSSGTRIQLLIAVRVAWIQSQERGVIMPLFADELMANSDDDRASAIVQALAELSREGRQIFYFTAQADELAKWKACLSGSDVPFSVVYLSTDESDATSPSLSAPLPRFEPINEIPFYEDLTYDEYLEKFDIKLFNPLVNKVHDIHVGVLLESPEALYHCLSLGLDRCGMLHNFQRQGLTQQAISSQELHKFELRYRAASELIRLLRIGRNLPVTRREVLEESGAVSSAFIDKVYECLVQSDFNPRVFLDALKAGKVPGFRNKFKDQLEEYLLQEGYITTESPLSPDELEVQFRLYLRQLPLSDHNFPMKRIQKYAQPTS